VRKASNLTAQEALRMNVIDLVAPSLPALLRTIDGRVTVPRHLTLDTAGAQIVEVSPGFFTRFLSTLIDPNIVSLLFLAGLAGLGFELFHPGVVIRRRVRSHLHGLRALRVFGVAALVGVG